jgi:hypothetical protein
VGAGMADALQFGHFRAVVETFAFSFHRKFLTADGRRFCGGRAARRC